MGTVSVEAITKIIEDRIKPNLDLLKAQWKESKPVLHIVIDDLIPASLTEEISNGFPEMGAMRRFDTIRERKSVSANYQDWGEATKNAFLALQSPKIMNLFSEISEIRNLTGDPSAYAGGISAMGEGDFLNPHLDNSTHPSIGGYRRLNALFYVTKGWSENYGGNLELWSPRMKDRLEVCSSFNRLVLMCTNRKSLHSVNKVAVPGMRRLCLSNYYFTAESPEGRHYSHNTSFRARPGEPIKDAYLRLEGKLVSTVQGIIGRPLKR